MNKQEKLQHQFQLFAMLAALEELRKIQKKGKNPMTGRTLNKESKQYLKQIIRSLPQAQEQEKK